LQVDRFRLRGLADEGEAGVGNVEDALGFVAAIRASSAICVETPPSANEELQV